MRVFIAIVLVFVVLFFLDFDAERLQELQILVVDLEFGIRRQGGNQRSLVWRFLALLADPDGGFEDQEDVVSTFLDAGDNLDRKSVV